MATKTVRDMFATAKEKSANDFDLAKRMLDYHEGVLRVSPNRVQRINEMWHLHKGTWPEMDEHLGLSPNVLDTSDREGRNINQNDFIIHHPKMNNITNYILGEMIIQPLIPIVRDMSAHGRKFREEERLKKTLAFYSENFFAPQQELIRQQYFQEIGVSDPLSLNPDEQKQVQQELQARMKRDIPKSFTDDLKKIKTPDEKITQVLLAHDIKAYQIEEMFILGGEQSIVSYEEYYQIGRKGVKPTIKSLNSKNVRWVGDEHCEYSDDGDAASVDEYMTTQGFVGEYGREVIKKKDFMKNMEKYFTEVPGYSRDGIYGRTVQNDPLFIEAERDFVDIVGSNPGLIKNDWRTLAGQQEIAGLYGSLSSFSKPGFGIRKVYTTFKWTETITYVQREELDDNNKKVINEYFFSADYKKDKSKDIMCIDYPINRVYHGTKVANRFYVGVEPVPWQFFCNPTSNFQPKLTICGRRYGTSAGDDEGTSTLMGPGVQYQMRYNISASKLEELERKDRPKVVFWNLEMKPESWKEEDYMEAIKNYGEVPYSDNKPGNAKGRSPAMVIDPGNSSKMDEYRRSMDMWENEMYKALKINRDALGMANPYQSNQQTQSNIQGASKQLLPFYNKRRLLKQRVLNAFIDVSKMCLIDDKEKQNLLFDDFSRSYMIVNADDIKASNTPIFIIDDFGEAQNVEKIKNQAVSILQNASLNDFINIADSKSIQEMKEYAELSKLEMDEAAATEHSRKMEQIQATNAGMVEAAKYKADRDDAVAKRRDQVDLMLGEMDSMTMENAADVDKNKTADSIQRALLEIQSAEKIAREKNETDLEKEKIKGKNKSAGKPPA